MAIIFNNFNSLIWLVSQIKKTRYNQISTVTALTEK